MVYGCKTWYRGIGRVVGMWDVFRGVYRGVRGVYIEGLEGCI